MTAVGFEPTRIAPPELESGALDRSAKLSSVLVKGEKPMANSIIGCSDFCCPVQQKLSNPGFEPGLPRPQRGVLTARRIRHLHRIPSSYSNLSGWHLRFSGKTTQVRARKLLTIAVSRSTAELCVQANWFLLFACKWGKKASKS